MTIALWFAKALPQCGQAMPDSRSIHLDIGIINIKARTIGNTIGSNGMDWNYTLLMFLVITSQNSGKTFSSMPARKSLFPIPILFSEDLPTGIQFQPGLVSEAAPHCPLRQAKSADKMRKRKRPE
jgi:hypothetical protein